MLPWAPPAEVHFLSLFLISKSSAMVYSFMGDIEQAKKVLKARLYAYVYPYLFAIWDSYRSTVDLNKIYYLLNEEETPLENALIINPFEINYLDKRSPLVSFLWAMTIPSVGQLYIHRIFSAFFTLIKINYSPFILFVHSKIKLEIENLKRFLVEKTR